MDQAAFFLSGAAVLMSSFPKVMPAFVWLAQCEACHQLRRGIAAIFGH